MESRKEILAKLTELLVEMFELDAADIKPETYLFDELDIDSIDAVDLIVRLREWTGEKVDPEDFKNVRTVDDVVVAVEELLNRAV